MYAIISDGSHQYRVEEGQVLEVQRKELPEGTETIDFDRVLFVGGLAGGPRIGTPVVSGAKVTATVLGEKKDDKVTIQKFRRRKGYSVKKGHRQTLLDIRVDKITV